MPIAVRRVEASAAELHALAMPTTGGTGLWIMKPTAPALVMGSAQRPEHFDLERLRADGVELAARRSGGGAVFIDPDETVWIDIVAPQGSPWWRSELGENFAIVGRCWHEALHGLGVATVLATQGPISSTAGRIACWAGVGWGELTIGNAKVLGLSQRRTRWGSRVQAMAVLGPSSGRVADYLLPGGRNALADRFSTDHVEVLRRAGVDPARLEAAVIDRFRA